ncbi:MAG TPA: hypothetical protein PLO23_00295 [Alphaproteobacteria bacterium]|nr:hypothetical protein [Alphaproteobacteria bacterium]
MDTQNPNDSDLFKKPEPRQYDNIVDFVYDPDGTGNLKIDTVIREDGKVAIYLDKPFKLPPVWIEYDMKANQLHFVMDDGNVRVLGLNVKPDFKRNMQNTHQILIVLMDYGSGQMKEGYYVPLIIHQL